MALALIGLVACDGQHRYDGPIIDVHLHAHSADRFGATSLPNPVTGRPSAATTNESLVTATIAAMRRHHIVRGYASSALDSVARYRAAAPDLIVGGAQIDQGIPPPDLARVRAALQSGELGFIGELGTEFLGMKPDDPTLEPYLALAEELDVPVFIHTGLGPPGAPYHGTPAFRSSLGNPMLWEEVFIKHPKMRAVLMHAGWPYLAETIAILNTHPQVYVDVAVIDWIIPREEFHDYLHALVRAGFAKRIMFGSDQMIWPEAIDAAIDGVDSATFLTAEQKRDIFYANAVRFLKLPN